MKVNVLVIIAVGVLAALVGRQLFPRTNTVVETIHLPSTTDTVTVTVTDIQTVYDTVFPPPPEPDILIIADTVWLTRPDTVQTMPLGWYLTALQAGQGLDEESYVYSVGLRYDGVLTRSESLEHFPHTLGPVRAIRADSTGVKVFWGEWPEQPKSCGFWCKAQWAVGGAAAGVIIGSAF